MRRDLGLFGAVMLGLGSIVGTGVFVSLGVAAGVVGPAVLLAVLIGAALAGFNGLSSAQLAAALPVSGGTYEYGYAYLNPRLGFTAGWLFLLAKSASAATAALGFSYYFLDALGVGPGLAVPVALVVVVAITLLVAGGLKRSNRANIVIVSVTLLSLVTFVLAGSGEAVSEGANNLRPFFQPQAGLAPLPALLQASALMFVAFTGYGRIATLGEEVSEPRRTIPRAIVTALVLVTVLYVAVAGVSVAAVGATALSGVNAGAAPLVTAARSLAFAPAGTLVTVGAMTAMLGVLLNLSLGLSRVLLAMGRRRDMPGVFARLNLISGQPRAAVLGVGALVALLVAVGNVKTTWSFSAFTVLCYYAITNLAALAQPAEGRRWPRWVSVAGLVGCLGLAFFVDVRVWLVGLGLVLLGLVWHWFARCRTKPA